MILTSRSKPHRERQTMHIHTVESLARDYNVEVIAPSRWQPPRFARKDWLWIKSIAQSGPTRDSRIVNLKVGEGKAARRLTCVHRTQPGRNFTVFYRRILFDMIMVLGVGSHGRTNQDYDVKWSDGSRNRVRLAIKKESGPQFLVNPIGGAFAFETLDTLINESCLAPSANADMA